MQLASASSVVKLNDFPTGEYISTYDPLSKEEIRTISWSKDGKWLAVTPTDGYVEIVSVKKEPRCLMIIRDIKSNCAAFSNITRKCLAIGTANKQVLIYNVRKKNVVNEFKDCVGDVRFVEFTAEDSHVVAVCDDGKLYLYSNMVKKLSSVFEVPNCAVISCVRCHPSKRNFIATGSGNGMVTLFDSNISKSVYQKHNHSAAVNAVAFSPIRSDLIVSTAFDRQLNFYDVKSTTEILSINLENNPTCVDFADDGLHVAVSGMNKIIYCYDIRVMKEPLCRVSGHSKVINTIKFRKGGTNSDDFSDEVVSVQDLTQEVSGGKNDTDLLFCDNSVPLVEDKKSKHSKQEDSFLQLLGLTSTSSANNSNQSIPAAPDTIPKSRSLQDSNKNVPEKQMPLLKQVLTSSPIFLSQYGNSPNLSPVQIPSVKCPEITLQQSTTDVQQIVQKALEKQSELFLDTLNKQKEIFVQALKNEREENDKKFAELEFEIKLAFFELGTEIRMLFNSMNVVDVTRFVKLDEKLDEIIDRIKKNE